MNDTDKELLEFAAKAAGNENAWSDGPTVTDANNRVRYWNPKENDGDALQLLATLRMQIYAGTVRIQRAGCNVVVAFDETKQGTEELRLAIFRVAVMVGKAMP